MEEIIKKIIQEYFADFKEYHLIIFIGFTCIIAIIQVIQSIVITKKIERFKNDLKKSEIRFSRFNELQVSALRNIYHQLVTFQYHNNLIFNAKYGDIGHKDLKNRINGWIQSYVENVKEFSKEKILLTSELKSLYSRTINDFEEVKKKLIDERNGLDYWELIHEGNKEAMYEFKENEIAEIFKIIEKLKGLDVLKNSNNNIQELRSKIEDFFQKMN